MKRVCLKLGQLLMYINRSFGRYGDYVPGHGATVSPATEWILGRAGVAFACEPLLTKQKV